MTIDDEPAVILNDALSASNLNYDFSNKQNATITNVCFSFSAYVTRIVDSYFCR